MQWKKTNGINTPSGRPCNLKTPPSSMEVGPMDSGEGQLLHADPFQKSSMLRRSPPLENNVLSQKIYQRSHKEQQIYNTWKAAANEEVNAMYRVDQLQTQVDNMHKMYEELSKKYSQIENRLPSYIEEKVTHEYPTV